MFNHVELDHLGWQDDFPTVSKASNETSKAKARQGFECESFVPFLLSLQ